QVLSDLRINQLLRHTPTEVLYDFVLVSDNLNERLWENLYTWTNRRSSNGKIVEVGNSNADGANVSNNQPDGSNRLIGVSFSHSLQI
ncbi:MAG: hypothetical protein V1707_00165, partial [bacterium]